jgi:hypothetical protein
MDRISAKTWMKSLKHPMVKVRLDQTAQDWIEARKLHRLSHAEVQ